MRLYSGQHSQQSISLMYIFIRHPISRSLYIRKLIIYFSTMKISFLFIYHSEYSPIIRIISLPSLVNALLLLIYWSWKQNGLPNLLVSIQHLLLISDLFSLRILLWFLIGIFTFLYCICHMHYKVKLFLFFLE